MNLEDLPDEPLERLAAYRKANAEAKSDTFFDLYRELYRTNLEEEERVKEATKKKPEDRTRADWEWIAYSPYGTASGCSCGGGC